MIDMRPCRCAFKICRKKKITFKCIIQICVFCANQKCIWINRIYFIHVSDLFIGWKNYLQITIVVIIRLFIYFFFSIFHSFRLIFPIEWKPKMFVMSFFYSFVEIVFMFYVHCFIPNTLYNGFSFKQSLSRRISDWMLYCCPMTFFFLSKMELNRLATEWIKNMKMNKDFVIESD